MVGGGGADEVCVVWQHDICFTLAVGRTMGWIQQRKTYTDVISVRPRGRNKETRASPAQKTASLESDGWGRIVTPKRPEVHRHHSLVSLWSPVVFRPIIICCPLLSRLMSVSTQMLHQPAGHPDHPVERTQRFHAMTELSLLLNAECMLNN